MHPLNHSYCSLTGLFIALAVFLTCHSVHAQKFSLGVKAGPLISWAAFGDKADKDDFTSKPKIGYAGSGFISFPLKNNYSCVIEGGFSQKGRRILFGGGDIENNAVYQFLDGTLLLRRSFPLNLGKNVPGTWFINMGPHISYWLSGKGEIGPTGTPTTSYTVVFEKTYTGAIDNKMYLNDVNRYLFGIDFGIGMTAPVRATQRVGCELRFTSGHTFYGRRNSASYSYVDFEDNLRANEKVFTFSVMYMFDFDLKKGKTGRSTKDKETGRKRIKRRR